MTHYSGPPRPAPCRLAASLILLAAALSACSPGGSSSGPRPSQTLGNILMSPSPVASTGSESLGRRLTSLDELISIVHQVTGRCPEPVPIDGATIAKHLPAKMAETVAAAAVCRGGYGVLLGTIRDQSVVAFQQGFRQAVRDNPALWRADTRQIMVGNGFFLLLQDPGVDRKELFPLGLQVLVCPAPTPAPTTTPAPTPSPPPGPPADTAGCFFGIRQR